FLLGRSEAGRKGRLFPDEGRIGQVLLRERTVRDRLDGRPSARLCGRDSERAWGPARVSVVGQFRRSGRAWIGRPDERRAGDSPGKCLERLPWLPQRDL